MNGFWGGQFVRVFNPYAASNKCLPTDQGDGACLIFSTYFVSLRGDCRLMKQIEATVFYKCLASFFRS